MRQCPSYYHKVGNKERSADSCRTPSIVRQSPYLTRALHGEFMLQVYKIENVHFLWNVFLLCFYHIEFFLLMIIQHMTNQFHIDIKHPIQPADMEAGILLDLINNANLVHFQGGGILCVTASSANCTNMICNQQLSMQEQDEPSEGWPSPPSGWFVPIRS